MIANTQMFVTHPETRSIGPPCGKASPSGPLEAQREENRSRRKERARSREEERREEKRPRNSLGSQVRIAAGGFFFF